MRVIGLSAAIALLCACTPVTDTPAAGSGDEAASQANTPSTPIAEPPVDAPPPQPAPDTPATARSEYSSLAPSDCKLTQRDQEAGGTTHRCAGVANFVLDMHDSDARM